jgi:hypothetical protein
MRKRGDHLNLRRCRHREQFCQSQDDQFRQGESTPSRALRQLDLASLAGWSLIRNVWSAASLQAKNEGDGLVCANVSGLFVSYCSWHLMECAALASYLVTQSLTTFSGYQVSRAPGSTVLPSHCSPANLAGNHNSVSSRRRWSAIVGIADAISKPGVFCQASIAGQFFTGQ